ncbi:hypothetical protein ABL78_4789 [Leptomonas seymouri]|uniref:Uncharacterized protein n=1 Tax=Leptomonas seymouri TaxID=5684 RepID=A0A0N1I318_LEPSE|nr:hypothetical protein ABL78_4789 [Leptomonas seymouri]|eukprot:KPI86134.1 hypothetical protein ABL78_4789 [Leptomonas seymouri]
MPGVDLLDAFAELVVCFVFNLPHDEPKPPNDDDDDNGSLTETSSSSATQIFSRGNSFGDDRSQAALQPPLNTRELAGLASANAFSFAPAAPLLSETSSTQSLDLYPCGAWHLPTRTSPHPTNLYTIAAHPQSSHPSSVVSLNTADLSAPGGSAQGTDRSAGFWNRLLGSSGVAQTPPRNSSWGQLPNTGVTTNASSYVQLTEDDLCAMHSSGYVGGTPGWATISAPPSLAAHSSPHLLDLNGEDSRGAQTSSNVSAALPATSPDTPFSPLFLSSPAPPPPPPSQHQQPQALKLNAHGLYTGLQGSPSPSEDPLRASSSSDFVVL